jgi:hypothetical protein
MQRRGLANLVLAGSACGIRPLAQPPRYRQRLRGLLPRKQRAIEDVGAGLARRCHRTGSPWSSTPLSTKSQPAGW